MSFRQLAGLGRLRIWTTVSLLKLLLLMLFLFSTRYGVLLASGITNLTLVRLVDVTVYRISGCSIAPEDSLKLPLDLENWSDCPAIQVQDHEAVQDTLEIILGRQSVLHRSRTLVTVMIAVGASSGESLPELGYQGDWRAVWIADALYRNGNAKAAKDLYEDFLLWHPEVAPALARVYRQRGDASMTIWLLDTAIESGRLSKEQEAQSEEMLGEVYRKLRRAPRLAVLHLVRALTLRGFPADSDQDNATTYYHLGNVFMVQGNLRSAIRSLLISRQLYSNQARETGFPDLALGIAYQQLDETEKALSFFCAAHESADTRLQAQQRIEALVSSSGLTSAEGVCQAKQHP